MSQIVENFEKEAPESRSLFYSCLERLWKNRLAKVCIVVIAAYFLLTIFLYAADVFNFQTAPAKWDQKTGAEYEPPNMKNPFGTDYLGRSVLRKTLYGAKVSMTVAFFASFLSFAIGVSLGSLAGYFRGLLDDIVVWLLTTFSAIPYILLILAFALVLKERAINLKWLGLGQLSLAGIPAICIAIGLTGWVGICRLVRAEVMKLKSCNFVVAAKAYGCSDIAIIFRHIIPNLSYLIIITFAIRFVYYIHAEAILGFIGLGVKNAPSWGSMIDMARQDLTKGVWWEMTAASAAIFLISLALNCFADCLKNSLDPKFRN